MIPQDQGGGEGAILMRISKFLYPPSIARCQHVKVNGVQCGSPALKNRKLCHFHQRWQQGRIQLNANQARRSRYSLDLPILEDANSIQVALMQGMRLLLTNQVDHRTAALLFYALQTASSNLSRTTFEPRPQQVVIDPSSISDTSLGDDAWYKEEFTSGEDEDEQEEAETNDESTEDSPQTINIHAMAESSPVGDFRRRAVSGFVSADSHQGDSSHGDSHQGDSYRGDSSQGDLHQGDSYQGTSSDVPQCRITNAPLGAAFRARVEPGLRPGPVGASERLQPSGRVRNKAGFASESSPGGAFELSPALQRGGESKKRLKSRRDDRVLTQTLQGQLRPATSRPRSPAFTSTRNPETAYKMMSYEDEACGANHWNVSARPGSHAVGGSAGG